MKKLAKSLSMDSPVHQEGAGHKGGLIKSPKTKKLGSVAGGKGTKKHLEMLGPDLAGGGWTK